MSGNFTVLNSEQKSRLQKLEAFYLALQTWARKIQLSKNSDIGQALTEVDPHWARSDPDELD